MMGSAAEPPSPLPFRRTAPHCCGVIGAAFFWLETLWWAGILACGVGATVSGLRNTRWAERRRQRRFAASMESRARAWRDKVRDDEIAEMRARQEPPAP